MTFDATFRAANSNATKQPHSASVMVHVQYDPTTGYTFSQYGAPNKREVCLVEQHIVYSMSIPNSNIITPISPTGIGTMADKGFVFSVRPIEPKSLNELAALFKTSQQGPIDNYVQVECARVGDSELSQFLSGIRCCGIIGKFVTGKVNKFGPFWLLHRNDWKMFQTVVDDSGAWVQYYDLDESEMNNPPPELAQKPSVKMEGDSVADTLRAIVNRGNSAEILEAIGLAVEYRDQQIENLKVLNDIIIVAKKKVIDASFS